MSREIQEGVLFKTIQIIHFFENIFIKNDT